MAWYIVCIYCIIGLGALAQTLNGDRHRLNGYLAQRVPGLFLASSFRTRFN